MADIFDVVADPTRRALLTRLQALDGGEISVGELVAASGISQPTVSKHLKTLRDHGLVSVREKGQRRYYRLDPAPLDALRGWADGFAPAASPSASDVSASGGSASGVTAPAAAPAADWPGTEVGERIGRVAATTAHTARSAWDRLPVVGRR